MNDGRLLNAVEKIANSAFFERGCSRLVIHRSLTGPLEAL
jgi:hypothetical protein